MAIMRLLKYSAASIFSISIAVSSLSSMAQAEDIDTLLSNVKKYDSESNYAKALEELNWVKKELEKKHTEKLASLLPEKLLDYTSEKAKTSSAMGMMQISKDYKNASQAFSIELVGGASGGAAQGLGGFAALGQMAAMFGQQEGTETLRLKGRTANIEDSSGKMTIFLDGGSMLNISKTRGEVDMKAIGEALDLDGIEGYLKGK